MKKKEKKLKGYLFIVPTYLILILAILLPLFYSFIYSKLITKDLFEVITLALTVLMLVLCSFIIFEVIFCMYHLYNNQKVDHNRKMLLYILLFFLNVFIIPYYYYTYMVPSNKKERRDNIYIYFVIIIILTVFSITSCIYSVSIYNSYRSYQIQKEKELKNVRTMFNSTNNNFDLTFKLGFEVETMSEYELYASDKKRNMMTGAFLYETANYEEKDANSILDKQVEYIKQNKKNVEVYKDKKSRTVDNKTIVTIDLLGNSSSSASSIYRLSCITFNNDNSKVLYVIETVLLEDYKKNKKELNEVLDSANLK